MTKYFLAILLMLNACGHKPHSAINTPVQPEHLVDFTSEKVTFSMDKASSFEDLKDWVKNDSPASAELACDQSYTACKKSADYLARIGVTTKLSTEHNNNIVLIYNKTAAHDCTAIAAKKHAGEFLLGCSNSVNILGMVSGYQQLTNPNLLGLRDAGYATQNYNNLYNISLQNME